MIGIMKENTTMGHTHRIIVVLVAVLALLGANPRLAAARSQVPFRAEMAESGVGFPPPTLCGPTLLCISGGGSGYATYLGKTSDVSLVVVDVSNPDCRANTRTVILTGARGDQISMALHGVSCRTGATSGITNISHDTYVVTGGTGRFSGATGQGTSTVYIYDFGRMSRSSFGGTVSAPTRANSAP
jgi:hypothetical protein